MKHIPTLMWCHVPLDGCKDVHMHMQVRQQVDAEFTNLEQEAAKKPRSTFPKRTSKGKFSRIDFQVRDARSTSVPAAMVTIA